MNPFYIYLWGQADYFKAFFATLAFVVFVWEVGSVVYNYLEGDDKAGINKLRATLAALFLFIASAIPNSKTIAAMFVLPEIAKSKAIQEDLPEIYDMAIKQLKASISEKAEK